MDNEHVRIFDLSVTCPNCDRPFIASVSLDSGVGHLIVPWHADPQSVKDGGPVIGFAPGTVTKDGPNRLLLSMPRADGKRLHMTIPTNLGGPCIGDPAKPTAFGLQRISPGVWTYDPSLLVPNILHAFVVVTLVPEPAPWEKTL